MQVNVKRQKLHDSLNFNNMIASRRVLLSKSIDRTTIAYYLIRSILKWCPVFFVISVTVDNFPIPKTIRIMKKRHHESHWSMEIVDFMVNHVYPFLGQGVIWQNQVEANGMNVFCIYNISVRHTVIELQPFIRLVIRTPATGSSKVKVDGTIRKSVYEFLFESVKKNDVGRTVFEI